VAAPKYAKKKDLNQPDVIAELMQAGCSVWVLHTPCDFLVGHRGHTYCIELKVPERPNRRTPEQRKFKDTWRGHYLVATSSEQILRAIGAMQ
jgi:hypothetical protein